MIHDGRLDLAYFWSSLLIVLLPATAFVVLAFLVTRGYLRRKVPDGGGPPPHRKGGAGRGT
ncbi:MAG TPA: hypothetical protein VFU41_10495 [Gemmatimonadales bacterium]|nr:hypothetical protein [Gemmatimonadales bacterium]